MKSIRTGIVVNQACAFRIAVLIVGGDAPVGKKNKRAEKWIDAKIINGEEKIKTKMKQNGF